MNFRFQRNPERLMRLAGIQNIENRRNERDFLEKIATMDATALQTLVLVVGGFLDQVLGNSYAVSDRYPADLREHHDVYFREHYEGRAMRQLVALYGKHGKTVILIGHSWGGDAATNAVARKVHVPIELLITLDPVSHKGPPKKKLSHVRHWLNIHVDYKTTPLLDIPNIVARIGGPWQAVPVADENTVCPAELTHAFAQGMFEIYAEPTLRRIIPE